MKSKPFLIRAESNDFALEPIQQSSPIHQESWLQKLLQDHPQVLPVDEIEPIFSPLVAIGREISTEVGPIDNLFISKSGYLVLVETKLWRNSEAKREVIAQAIDYGSALSKWSFQKLDDVTRNLNSKGLIELIQTELDLDVEDLPTEDLIAKNLRLGRFLILVVSDKIRESLIDMLNFVNRYPHLAANVGLVEMQCYSMPGSSEDILVVPSIVARTQIIERSIVQVNLSPNVDHQIVVEQKKSEEVRRQGRTPLTEDAFWELLQQNSPESVQHFHTIVDHMSGYPEVLQKMRQSAISFRLVIPDSDQRISLFFITTYGSIECWPETILGQLRNSGIESSIGLEYQTQMSKILRLKRKGGSIYNQAPKVNLESFFKLVDWFVLEIIKTERTLEEENNS
jgi:hypothetical protein